MANLHGLTVRSSELGRAMFHAIDPGVHRMERRPAKRDRLDGDPWRAAGASVERSPSSRSLPRFETMKCAWRCIEAPTFHAWKVSFQGSQPGLPDDEV
jgi:hypothetical protein